MNSTWTPTWFRKGTRPILTHGRRARKQTRVRPQVETLEDRVTPSRYFVNDDVMGGSNDGSSWANAFSDLQAALRRRRQLRR